METKSDEIRSMIISYRLLRRLIGILGMALPLALVLGALIFFDTGFQSSISSYYYTGMRSVFVGTMCVIGFFMLSYRGYESIDNIYGDLACVFAIGVALFPALPDGAISVGFNLTDHVHLIFSSLFFITLIYFSLCLFTKTDKKEPLKGRKLHRNNIYKGCGYIMTVCILLMVIFAILPREMALRFEPLNPIFWLEAAAIMAFGFSWLIKGETLFADPDQSAKNLAQN